MKTFFLLTSLVFSLLIIMADDAIRPDKPTFKTRLNSAENETTTALQGAWTNSETNEAGEKITAVTIVMDGYLAESYYNETSGAFINTFGGSWTVDKNVFYLTLEFSSSDSSAVGKTKSLVFDLQGRTITFEGSEKVWTKIDDGQKSELNGAWLMTGRKRDGSLVRRIPGDRKTMKILSDTRFQWIAYNTATGKFFGTGGGTYTAENGTYTERIEFFSRDKDRVGAKLSFQYEVMESEWHHSGLSSKGKPIYEIWSPRILPSMTGK